MKKQKIFTYCTYRISRKHLNLFNSFIFFLSLTQVGFPQDCKTQAANKPSTLVTAKDEIASPTGKMSASDMAKMKPHLAKAEKWVKNIVANFTGAKMLYYNNFFPDYLNNGTTHNNLYKTTGMTSYFSSKMMFFQYYCQNNKYPINTEVESGSTIQVFFNNVFAFSFTEDEGVYTINGKHAFKVIQKKRSEGRIDFYEQRSQNNADAKMYTANDFIILRNSDKPVFLPVTRREYLEQMLKDVSTSTTKDNKTFTDMYNLNLKQFEVEMKFYKEKDKTYTPEKEAKRRKWFDEDQEKLRKTISNSSSTTVAAKAEIQQYLKKPTEWLNRSFNSFYPHSTYTVEGVRHYFEGMDKPILNGAGEVEEVIQKEIVSINPAYFNKTLSSDVPQLLLVHLRNGTYAHMLKVGSLVKQPAALAPLEAILNSR